MNDVATTGSKVVTRIPEELVSSALFLLKRLGMSAKERSFSAYEELGLHPYHHAILAVLDELEAAGLIERRRDQTDRRRHVVEMTAVGRKTLAKLRALSKRLEEEFLAPLDEHERTVLHGLLLELAEEHLPTCRGLSAP